MYYLVKSEGLFVGRICVYREDYVERVLAMHYRDFPGAAAIPDPDQETRPTGRWAPAKPRKPKNAPLTKNQNKRLLQILQVGQVRRARYGVYAKPTEIDPKTLDSFVARKLVEHVDAGWYMLTDLGREKARRYRSRSRKD